MRQYICFYEDYLDFVADVKYKIKDETEKFYIIGSCKIPKGRKDLYWIGEIIG